MAAGGLTLAGNQPLPLRLAYIFSELSALLQLHRPDVAAVEEAFYSVNAKSALKLGQCGESLCWRQRCRTCR